MKRLAVNADDFGFTSCVNQGILQSYLHGIVRSTSLMANGSALEQAVCIAREHPGLDVGCHLTLVQGESLSRPGTRLPDSLAQLLTSIPDRQAMIDEFRAQIDALLSRGIRPTHLDTHKHVHFLPPVLDAVALVADEYSIRWVRKPFDIPFGWRPGIRAFVGLATQPLRIPFAERLRDSACRTTDYFAGFAATGSLTGSWLASLLATLPDGLGEFVCHPGVYGPELEAADTRLKESREAEMEALCSTAVKRAVADHGVRIVAFRELAGQDAESAT